MLCRFCMGQQLRALLSSDFIPPEMTRLLFNFDCTFQANMRGTLFNDILAFDESQGEGEQDANLKDLNLRQMSRDKYQLLHE